MSFLKKTGKAIANFFKKIGNFFVNVWCGWKKIQENNNTNVKRRTVIEKVRNIALAAIIVILAVAGIYFILKADLELKRTMWKVTNEIKKLSATDKETGKRLYDVSQGKIMGLSKALGLMIAIILSFGAGIVAAVSEINRSKPWLVYLLKVVALVLAAGFVVFVMKFDTIYLTNAGIKEFAPYKLLPIILGYVGMGAIVVNIVSNALLGIEE